MRLSVLEPPMEYRKFSDKTPLHTELVLMITNRQSNPAIIPTIYNIANLYGGSEHGLTFFHSEELRGDLEQFRTGAGRGWENIRFIQIGRPIHSFPADYNDLLVSSAFYEQFSSKFIVLIQSDVMLVKPIEDWMYDYDYMGAPWARIPAAARPGKPQVGNGGYCIRKVSTMKEILKTKSFQGFGNNEDVFWQFWVDKLPTEQIAVKFSVEENVSPWMQGFDLIPSGVHKPCEFEPFNYLGDAFRLFLSNNPVNNVTFQKFCQCQ